MRYNWIGLTLTFAFLLSSGASAQISTPSLTGYGQIDHTATNRTGGANGFRVRRLNIISDASLDPKTRFLVDVEFEGGTELSSSSSKGTVKLSRLFIEHTPQQLTHIRLGKFLTPFGLYNEIHDFSSTYTPIEPPRLYQAVRLVAGQTQQRLFSKYNTGLQLRGQTLGEKHFEYIAYYGNGRDEAVDGSDENQTPGYGLRMISRFGESAEWQVGFSGYFDHNKLGFAGVSDDREDTLGLDLQYEGEFWLVQAEILKINFGLPTNARQDAGSSYFLLGYNFTDQYTPYLVIANQQNDLSKSQVLTEVTAGVRMIVSPKVIVKAQVATITGDPNEKDGTSNTVYFSTAIAF